MAKSKRARAADRSTIAVNKRARHDYFIEETLDAGLVLEGWEVKSLRDGRGQLTESYVQLKDGEAWLTGAHISPLRSASTHVDPDPVRPRKLLLHRRQLAHLFGAVERRGFTAVALRLYWSRGHAKLEIGVAKGKKQYDKRATARERDWQREKERALRHSG